MQQETSIRQHNGRNIEADRKGRSSSLDTATILPEDQTMLSLSQIFTWNRRTFTCKIRHPPALRCKKLQHPPLATCDLSSRLCFFINDISALSASGFTRVMSVWLVFIGGDGFPPRGDDKVQLVPFPGLDPLLIPSSDSCSPFTACALSAYYRSCAQLPIYARSFRPSVSTWKPMGQYLL